MNPTLNTIKLEADSGLKRNLRNPLPEDQVENYKKGLLGEYDFYTIFYDVFLLDDCTTIVAMGPPLLNLEAALLPVTLNINGRTLKFKTKIRHKYLSTLTARLPDKLPDNHPVSAEISFANGLKKTIHLQLPTPLRGNVIVALQRDNKIEWIKDWVNYYRSQPYVENIVIYDNNSNNQAEVISSMDGIASVIPWPFPYGIIDRSGNKFCQVGAFNHFKARYARDSLIFHFDIDELLVVKTKKAERAIYSNRQTRFNNFFVPYMAGMKKNYSFSDFSKRYATARNGGYKYVVRSDLRGVMTAHYFFPVPGFLYRLLPKKFSRGPVLNTDDAYFLHYRGITKNWKKYFFDRFTEYEQDHQNLIDDFSVIDAFDDL